MKTGQAILMTFCHEIKGTIEWMWGSFSQVCRAKTKAHQEKFLRSVDQDEEFFAHFTYDF